MSLHDFYHDLPAIWLVFADTYLSHGNAPQISPDHREKSLIDLFHSYLSSDLESIRTRQLYDEFTITQLSTILNLFELWSKDLKLIYEIRECKNPEPLVRKVAQHFLERVTTFEDCTVIPNGLISAEHTAKHENVILAILKKQNGSCIDWIQVNPGGLYHQRCPDLAGEKCNAYFEIAKIDLHNITEDWLYLLVGLKTVKLNDFFYKEKSLYECLLAHLNGTTTFKSQPDEDFDFFCHTSPIHTWQVIDKSFRYLLRHFIGTTYDTIYWRLLLDFKLFLMEKTFNAYQNKANKKVQQCHYLLQEMCRQIAQQILDHGNQNQKNVSLILIDDVKAAMKEHYSQQNQEICCKSQLNEPHISSLSFLAPKLINRTYSPREFTLPDLPVDPVFRKPMIEDDIIDYLRQFKCNFIDKLVSSKQLRHISLLSYGIEEFFIEYLTKTNILQKSTFPFSKDDIYLAKTLTELAETYYSCLGRLVIKYVSQANYQPQFYAKNLIVQFFVYAAVTALNLRDTNIGPLLSTYNLSTDCSRSLALNEIVPQLVIHDCRYLKTLFLIQAFFTSVEGKKVLFSNDDYNNCTIHINNEAEENNIDVAFAYELLKKDYLAYARFVHQYRDLEDEKLNRKWSNLTYSTNYLPSLYCLLFKTAYLAKASLTGFPSSVNCAQIGTYWNFNTWRHWYTVINFCFNGSIVSKKCNQKISYLVESHSFQRIICKPNVELDLVHFVENEIVASQDEKPVAMDCIRYMHLGFLQSNPWLKLERLFIAIKNQQLNFSCHEESTLIKQTLFEVSLLKKFCSLLECTAKRNPYFIHKLGLLCVEKALAMKYRLTQHPAISEILEVVLGLLTFYPPQHKNEFIKNIIYIYYMLKDAINQSPVHLSENTLLHLNAYLIISMQANPQLIESEALFILKAFLAINNYKIKGFPLDNKLLIRIYTSCCTWSVLMEHQLDQCRILLNELILSVLPQWDPASVWQKVQTGLFTCGDYAVNPMIGVIYFKNQPITGLPDSIKEHHIYKEYLNETSFLVIPGCREIDCYEVACYLSVDYEPQMRLTLFEDTLLIEEWIEGNYQLYVSPKELLSHAKYPRLFHELPHNEETLRHWRDNDNRILIKDQQKQIIYQWDLQRNSVFSLSHQGFVIPWEQLEACYFKTWLEHVEEPDWIEIIAKRPFDSPVICIQSLHFPRLGLDFDYKQGIFSSRQIYCYYLAKQQWLNVLQGFSNYLILETKEENSENKSIKIVIPHRKIKPINAFYTKSTIAKLKSTKFPSFFVYDLDQKISFLKANHIRAQLYLTLLYYCSASLDDNDVSHCNAYHLARENLEICWKDQPYDNIELDIIQQILDKKTRRDYHSHRVALYLKVVSLVISSLRLAFLFMEPVALQNKERSEKLLKQCCQQLPHLLTLYLQNKPTIFARIRLSTEEEKEIISYCLTSSCTKDEVKNQSQPSFEEEENEEEVEHCLTSITAYFKLHFENQPEVSVSKDSKKFYKKIYQQLFDKEKLISTSFAVLFQEHIQHLSFAYDTKKLNFLIGIDGILIDRFRLIHFIALYKIAKSSVITIAKYNYLLHHTVLRAIVNKDFPAALVMMLARSLLLVAKNPEQFPEAPSWFDSHYLSVDLSKRKLTEFLVVIAFPSYSWVPPKIYDKIEEEVRAREKARREDEIENKNIWSCLKQYDLNSLGIPRHLPDDPNYFTLKYESLIKFSDCNKRSKVRELYLQAARNDAMYQFFVNVLQQCDQLKYSTMGWAISPFTYKSITMTIIADILPQPLTQELINFEKEDIPQESLVDLTQYFIVKKQPMESNNFLFEAQLNGPTNGYERQFYSELKDSWVTYHKETECSYDWVNAQAIDQLKNNLQTTHAKIKEQAEVIWGNIEEQFKQRPNTESDHYFALRWYSGQVPHYHKGDLLSLLVRPQKITEYNPSCVLKKGIIIKNLLLYINNEIKAAKIIRVFTCIQQYKQVESDTEQFSIVQCLVKTLQENLDVTSYRYPHWLLFQLENDVIVRNNQQELIIAMLNQTDKVMYQLNMGEGKSSVILPLLSCNLANGKQLLRINVLSSLIITMKDFLRKRFSGLMKKHIYTLPFYRDTDISTEHLTLILQSLTMCQQSQHILIVTPEHRLCLQLKVRELMIENQKQMDATGIFNWQTYRKRTLNKDEVYQDLTEEQKEELLAKQDQHLKTCLCNEKYIDKNNKIIKMPPRGQGRKEFARFKEIINDSTLREWSCLKAAYLELLYNYKLAYMDSSEKLALLNKINGIAAVDLLDESDEILKHGTELNYTMGDKHVFSGEELRWQIPQFFIKTIFCDPVMRDIITAGKNNGLTEINLHYSSRGGVPFIQFLNEPYYEKRIKPLLIKTFFSEHLPTLRKYCMNVDGPLINGEASSLRQYITGQLPLSTEKKIILLLADKGPLKDKLLIGKGWLSHGILFHVFNAKYRVQYGLAVVHGQMQKQIAVPFWGKDMPSPRSEFSHPDVMLGFTIISYLYQGLNQQQVKETLIRLKNKFSEQVADTHLRNWTEASRAWIEPQTGQFPPLLLTSFEHLDLADEQCLTQVHKYLSDNYHAIFFYLNQFVLIEEAKQYLYKISANAHSLVGYDAALGFSGTDDRKITMPFEIKSLRSNTEKGTNGKMLSVLTQERNSHYYSLKIKDTSDLLKQLCDYIQRTHCHALIDAGALITGLTNYKVASFLMDNLPNSFLGILYFSDSCNDLTVLTRDKQTVLLQDCYLDKQYLFAYLDDVHTRGTDIKLPLSCHAILTIGMGMQKDKLMQAAMRLRQLAKKQSVSLWGTHFVTLAIARDNQIDAGVINSLEVIRWVTRNTINQINDDLFPVVLRKIQFQFLKTAETWLKEASTAMDTLIQCCQEKELFLLEEFYALSSQREDLGDRLNWLISTRIRTFWKDLEQELINKKLTHTTFYEKVFNKADKKGFKKKLKTICKESEDYLEFGYVHHSLDNDEEREVEVEIIQEQQVLIKRERRDANTEKEWDVNLILQKNFVKLAEEKCIIMLIKNIRYFVQMPVNLKNIIWHPDIYMTDNFVNTLKYKTKDMLDNYLRPVDVVLIHRLSEKSIAVLLSGHEAADIKSKCYQKLNNNVLLHIGDIDGPTMLPLGSTLSKQELKLLTIIKLFSGECRYSSSEEIRRLAKRVGRLYPHYFASSKVITDSNCSEKLYGILIENGYLDFAGIITQKLLKLFAQNEREGECSKFKLCEHESHSQYVLKKLKRIYDKLIIEYPCSLKDDHYTLWLWIGTRGRLKEYHGSELESILNSEYQLKCSA